ncbi:hypothetical protein D3845_00920 [Streptococcus mutans]|nr:hypothetical protein [Streptococcus mutans]
MRNLSLDDDSIRANFKKKADKMLPSSDKVFLFEGKVNKKYYQKIDYFRPYRLENGGSCSNIVKKVLENKLFHGVIDGDFEHKNFERIYQIDFYSIENIILIYNSEFKKLVKILKKYYKDNETIRKRLVQDTSKNKFSIRADKPIEKTFHKYIDETINDENTFLKYMDLKKLANSYSNFIIKQNSLKVRDGLLTSEEERKIKEKNIFLKKYIDNSRVIDLNNLFNKSELNRLRT